MTCLPPYYFKLIIHIMVFVNSKYTELLNIVNSAWIDARNGDLGIIDLGI